MNAQVETPETAQDEIAEVVEFLQMALPAGGMEKFKVVVQGPTAEGQVAQGEFGPYDTPEKADEVRGKFAEKGYAAEVAVIFTCGSAVLALRQWGEAQWPEAPEVESGEVDNSNAVAEILSAMDENESPVDPAALRDEEHGKIEPSERGDVEEAAHAENEARAAEAAKPQRPARRSRSRKSAEEAVTA